MSCRAQEPGKSRINTVRNPVPVVSAEVASRVVPGRGGDPVEIGADCAKKSESPFFLRWNLSPASGSSEGRAGAGDGTRECHPD